MKANPLSRRSKAQDAAAMAVQRSHLLVHELEDAMHQVEEQVRKVKKSLAIKPLPPARPVTRH
jgi:hypothetical protein